jgi:hypothetical protein
VSLSAADLDADGTVESVSVELAGLAAARKPVTVTLDATGLVHTITAIG